MATQLSIASLTAIAILPFAAAIGQTGESGEPDTLPGAIGQRTGNAVRSWGGIGQRAATGDTEKVDSVAGAIAGTRRTDAGKTENEGGRSYRDNSASSQELVVTTGDSGVEIFVNGKSHGESQLVTLYLPPGVYSVEGRKPGCFTDYELEMVEEKGGDEVSLHLKKMRLQLSSQWGVLLDSGEALGPVFSLEAGLKTIRHYWGAFLLFTDTRNNNDEGVAFFATGATYNFIIMERKNIIFETGAILGYAGYNRNKYTWQYEVISQYQALVAGPQMTFQLGFDHLKLIASGRYFIRFDENQKLFSYRNPLAITLGGSLAF